MTQPPSPLTMLFSRHTKRREFITLLGGAAAAWPIAARSQTGERTRRIGVLMNLPSDDPEGMARLAAFLQGLQELGWTVGRNVRIDYRWGVPDADRIRKHAAELLALTPDVILSSGTPSVGASQQASRTVPIVFAQVPDPVGAGFVESLARPGGNITGFGGFEYCTSGKWLELLKEVAPHITRAAVLRDPAQGLGTGQLAAIQAVAPPLGVELTPMGVSEHGDYIRLPELAADLGNRRVNVITAVGGDPSPRAAKRATSTIPIVFGMGGDPVADSPDWLKMKNPAAPAVKREAEEDWVS